MLIKIDGLLFVWWLHMPHYSVWNKQEKADFCIRQMTPKYGCKFVTKL